MLYEVITKGRRDDEVALGGDISGEGVELFRQTTPAVREDQQGEGAGCSRVPDQNSKLSDGGAGDFPG